MSVPVLHMSAISKRFPGVVALDGVDFETANVGGNRTNGALRKAPPADVTVPADELRAGNAAAATRPTG